MKNLKLLTIIFTILVILNPRFVYAEIGGLTKCSESPAFQKRLKSSVKKLQQRMDNYEYPDIQLLITYTKYLCKIDE